MFPYPLIKTAMAETLTISSAEQPRERSLAGRSRPWMIGPVAVAPAMRWTSLYPILPASRSGKMSTLALPATGEPGAFFGADFGNDSGVELQFAVGGNARIVLLEYLNRLNDLVNVLMCGGTLGGKRKKSHLGVIADQLLQRVGREAAIEASCSAVGLGTTAQSAT